MSLKTYKPRPAERQTVTSAARYRDCYICRARIMHERRVCMRDIAAEISAAENGKAAAARCVMRNDATSRAKIERGISRGISRNCCVIFTRRYLVRLPDACDTLLYFFMYREESVLHARSCAKVQADAGNGVDRRYEIDAPDCLAESHRLDKTPGVRTRENKSVGGIVAFSVKRNVRICAYLRVVYEIFYEILCAIEISKFTTAIRCSSLKLSRYK